MRPSDMKRPETATIAISRRAVALMREIATAEGCTPRQTYLSEDCLADKWF
jgi:hypothetical protein